MQTRQVKNLIRASAIAAGVLATTLLGLACLRYSFAEPLVRLSYDFTDPFGPASRQWQKLHRQ